MKHLFIPYELAVIAKEKLYNEPCFAFYFEDDLKYCDRVEKPSTHTNDSLNDLRCYASPLYQQVVDWFRETHGIIIDPFYAASENNFACILVFRNDKNPLPFGNYKSYYQVLNKAIEEAFKLI